MNVNVIIHRCDCVGCFFFCCLQYIPFLRLAQYLVYVMVVFFLQSDVEKRAQFLGIRAETDGYGRLGHS